jgi:hypothetical protein
MTVPTLALALVAVLAGTARAGDCPTTVKTTIEKAFPKSTISRCRPEKEDGHAQFEVKLTRHGGGTAEVDVSPDGKILQIEEPVALDKVPATVMKAFAAKYPKAKATRAEKETPTGRESDYELAFVVAGKRHEAKFTASGKFVEDEQGDED